MNITFKGDSMTLLGGLLATSTAAPSFTAVAKGMNEKTLGDFKGKTKVVTTFLSLDTPVCDAQVREFNQRAADMGDDVVVIGVSRDLPFAMDRFCSFNDIDSVTLLSDYKTGSFGINYGLLIKELNLLARSVMIIDQSDGVRYVSVVEEATDAPDYDAAAKALDEILKKPVSAPEKSPFAPSEDEEIARLGDDVIEKHLSTLTGWTLSARKTILSKKFEFDDFAEAKAFLDVIAILAEDLDHHPDVKLGYGELAVSLSTHKVDGLSIMDFLMAERIDAI